jgi:hypothetical protein
MSLLDTGVDIANLDTGTGSRSAAGGGPRARRVDDLVALAQVRVVKRVVLCALHHRCGCYSRQRRAIELHRHCVKGHIVLARNLCCGRIRSQPTLEFVPLLIQLCAV